jgi:hypothetical protein
LNTYPYNPKLPKRCQNQKKSHVSYGPFPLCNLLMNAH